ncbi:ASCH domain-containing protein [Novosphingobium sp.]|uniref:ASCH domain-containing protein n=1 Tax=Novosphingobium sp. TaxID=1874826 RepID=UPI00262C0848|nr:ASCH domain-containing protein [Novosphingobium sp.]
MVALSFKGQFAEPIVAKIKRQTIRAGRKRPPRAGERLQLYVGMRTKQCRKIIPDPICTEVRVICITVDPAHPQIIAEIDFSDFKLREHEIERFAMADGFVATKGCSARRAMGNFWMRHHGPGEFLGLLIRWEPN